MLFWKGSKQLFSVGGITPLCSKTAREGQNCDFFAKTCRERFGMILCSKTWPTFANLLEKAGMRKFILLRKMCGVFANLLATMEGKTVLLDG